MTDYRSLHDLARRQHRTITYRQVRDEGVSDHRLQRWVRDGMLDHPFPSVYAFPGAMDRTVGYLRGATLSVGDPVLAYGATALWLHGVLDREPAPLELVVPHRRRAPELPRLTVHRSRTLLSQDATAARGVPTASVPRALADLAFTTPVRRLHAITLDALQRGRTHLDAIAHRASQRLDVNSRQALSAVIARIAPDRPDSIFEAEVRDRLRSWGYHADPGPLRLALADRVVTIDVPFSAHRLGIECDGFGYHADRAALDRDHRKSNLLQVEGWTLLRVTWQRLMTDWAGFMAEFRSAAAAVGLQPRND